MKYKGNKALMKCCKNCTDKRGIKCLGNPQIVKHLGFRFCYSYSPGANLLNKRIMNLVYKVNFQKKVNYYSDEVAITTVKKQAEILAPEVEEIAKECVSVFKRVAQNIIRMVNNLGKSKDSNKKETY